MGVRKTTIAIDEEKLESAKEILGTSGIRDTVDAALGEITVRAARERLIEQLRTMDGLDLDDPDVMKQAWH